MSAARAQLLRDARGLIADPAAHTTGLLARNAAGFQVHPSHPEACQWCAAGALYRLGGVKGEEPRPQSVKEALEALAAQSTIGRPYDRGRFPLLIVAATNDHSHAATLAMFDAAIAAEEGGKA